MNLQGAFKCFADAVTQRGDIEFYTRKINKHINDRNVERVISYICHYFENNDILDGQHEPSVITATNTPILLKAINFIKSNGYIIKVGAWKNIGTQIIIFKDDVYYHSKYNW